MNDQTSWNVLAVIVIPLALFVLGVVVSVVGWLLIDRIRGMDEKADEALALGHKNRNRTTRLETVLIDRGMLSPNIRYHDPDSDSVPETA